MAVVTPMRLVTVAVTAATIAACSSSGVGGDTADRTRPPSAVASSLAPSPEARAGRAIILGSAGLGPVDFGTGKKQTTAELTRLLGPPSGHGINTGCGPRFTEVQWRELAVEFHDNVFTGYRDIDRPKGDLELAPANRGYPPIYRLQPDAKTAAGVALGDSLGQVRAAYGKLSLIGANRHQAPNGISFVDDSLRSPAPPQARIIEIRILTCGTY